MHTVEQRQILILYCRTGCIKICFPLVNTFLDLPVIEDHLIFRTLHLYHSLVVQGEIDGAKVATPNVPRPGFGVQNSQGATVAQSTHKVSQWLQTHSPLYVLVEPCIT